MENDFCKVSWVNFSAQHSIMGLNLLYKPIAILDFCRPIFLSLKFGSQCFLSLKFASQCFLDTYFGCKSKSLALQWS